MSDIIARGMAANAMSSGGGGGGGTTVDAYSKNETDNLLRGKANASDVYTTTQTDDLLDDKVNKVSGKGLSTNDYTNEDMSLVKTISNKANTNDVNASITNLQNQISETSENVDTINTELMTNAGYSLGMSINPTTFELTMTLKNSTGGTVSSQKVDLPIESMVVSASYANGKLSLKLQNGQTLDTDISAIVAGLVNQNFTIAGIDMKDNIEANELKTALGINTITSDVSTLKNDMSTAKTNISTIQSDISGLKTRDSELQSDIDENTTAIEQNKSDILTVKNDIATIDYAVGSPSKNLFDFDTWKINALRFTLNGTAEEVENGFKLTATNSDCFTGNSSVNATYKIPVRPNTDYIISWDADSDIAGSNYVFFNGVTSNNKSNNNKFVKKFSFKTLSDTTFITVRFGVSAAGNSITYSNIMIQPANITDNTYEPYVPSVNERLTANEKSIIINQSTIGFQSKNILKNYTEATVREHEGITYTINADGTIIANGTTGSNPSYCSLGGYFEIAETNDFILNGCATGGGDKNWALQLYKQATPNDAVLFNDYGSGYSGKIEKGIYRGLIVIRANRTATNLTFKPMLRYAGTDDTYVHYVPTVLDRINTLVAEIAELKAQITTE